MDLSNLSIKKIRELIVFTALLVVALWKFDVVLDVLKTIGQIIFPFILGGAIVFVINVPMSFLEKKIFENVKKENKAVRKLARPVSLLLTIVLVVGVIALAVPATILCGVYLLGGRKYLFISLLVLLEVMLPFALLFERRGPTARELVLLAVLSALCVAGRAAFSALPQFKPVLALVIVSGVALGGEAGFLTGALAMLLSNVMYGQGPWTPWQMFAMGLCGFLAGVLYRRGLLRRGRVSLCIYGALSALLIYGVLMNISSALLWQGTVSWATIGAYLLSGFPVDCVHAAATVCFLWLFGEPMLEKLDRIKVKYGLLA